MENDNDLKEKLILFKECLIKFEDFYKGIKNIEKKFMETNSFLLEHISQNEKFKNKYLDEFNKNYSIFNNKLHVKLADEFLIDKNLKKIYFDEGLCATIIINFLYGRSFKDTSIINRYKDAFFMSIVLENDPEDILEKLNQINNRLKNVTDQIDEYLEGLRSNLPKELKEMNEFFILHRIKKRQKELELGFPLEESDFDDPLRKIGISYFDGLDEDIESVDEYLNFIRKKREESKNTGSFF